MLLAIYTQAKSMGNFGEPKSATDLERHVFIDYIEDIILVQETHWLLDVIGMPNVALRTSSMFAQQNAAAAGLGIVLLPIFSGTREPRLRPVLPNIRPKRDLWLSVHEDMQYLSRVKAVIGFLTELIKRGQHFLLEGTQPRVRARAKSQFLAIDQRRIIRTFKYMLCCKKCLKYL